MKYIDINNKFTAAVNGYLAKGYHFNTATMGGSQGEIAAVDLTNGEEIIRVVLNKFYPEHTFSNAIELLVGRVKESERVTPDSPDDWRVVWNQRLETISSEKFYDISRRNRSNSFYGTEEEAITAEKKRSARYYASNKQESKDVTDKAAPLVKGFIRRKFGVKHVVVGKIHVSKKNGVYTVTYNNHNAQLH